MQESRTNLYEYNFLITKQWISELFIRSCSVPKGISSKFPPMSIPTASLLRVVGSTLALVFFIACLLAMSPIFSSQQSTVTPVSRTDEGILPRQAEVIRRARESAPVDLIFVGDSITQAWEDGGAAVWKERFAPAGAINLGVSGDRTEYVLWRLDQAPLTRLAPKAVVLLIGTNNLGHGTANAAQTFIGIRAVVAKIQTQVPSARILLCAIFPREENMNAMRGDVAQVNQALASAFANESSVRVMDLCTSFIAADGKIPARLMPDFLHLSPAGYQVWADGIRAPLADALKK